MTGIALIKVRDTCGVVIGFRSRSMHRDLTPVAAAADEDDDDAAVVSAISIFKTLFR